MSIAHAALEAAWGFQSASVSDAVRSKAASFMAPKTYASYASGNYDGALVR